MDCAILTKTPALPYVDGICKKLFQSKITFKIFDWDGLDDDMLSPDNFPVLFIADAQNCPAFLPNRIEEYMKKGGRVLTIGGPPFDEEFYSINNEEVSSTTLTNRFCDGDFDKTVICPFTDIRELEDFIFDTTNPDNKKLSQTAVLAIKSCDSITGKALFYGIENFYINESFEKPITVKENHNVIGFWAKADESTKTVTIELIDTKGNVFKSRITPTTSFEFFMLSSRDFRFCGNINGVSYSNKARPDVIISNVCKIRFGHALSHAYSVAGPHEFYISELSSGFIGVLNDKKVSIDGLYPPYKFYPVTNAQKVVSSKSQSFLSENEFPIPKNIFSLSPRAQATGIDKGRRFRFVPLIDCFDQSGLHCGYAAYMMINFAYGHLSSSVDGSMLAVFTTNDDNFYQNGGDDAVAQTIKSLLSPVHLLEGGTNEYIYDSTSDAKARYGAVVLAKNGADVSQYQLKILYKNIVSIYAIEELLKIKSQGDYTFLCITTEDEPFEGEISICLTKDDAVFDLISHEVTIYQRKSEEECHFATIKNGTNDIFIDDTQVRFFGVNYMPRSSAGMDTHEEFEHYVSAFAYDPKIIETDLLRMVDIGINAVSIFMHYEPSINSNNILHLVELCKRHGLYVVLSIRPHANPFDFNVSEVSKMITTYGFETNDTIIGYDIAWERYVGTYEPCYGNFLGRKSFDDGFRKFLLSHYETFENAERFFGCKLTRNQKGEVISPTDDMLRSANQDDEHLTLIAVYRRYIDGAVAAAHLRACDFIKSIDKNHLITARSGDASTIPLVDPGIYGYDFASTALALDFTAPESYALSDDINSMRQGVFTNIYSRYANPNAVVQWMEFGKSIWTGSNFTDNSTSLKFQADYYKSFFDMLMLGHTSGLYAWWWAGGYRIGENSDFGIISPDGSDRPVTKVFREYAKKFLDAPPLSNPNCFIEIDRDLYPDGLRGMYNAVEAPLFRALGEGLAVEFVDKANGKTSKDVSLEEVGNRQYEGYLLKHLDAVVVSLTAILDNGNRIALQSGDTLNSLKSKAFTLSVKVINSTYATWLCGDEDGSVSLVSDEDSAYQFSLPLYADVKKRERASFHITIACEEKGTLSCHLTAKNRCHFGEKIKLNVI